MGTTPVSDTGIQELSLEVIAGAAQVMAAQNSVEGVATALLNEGLTVSGSTRGIVALSSSGPLSVKGNGSALGAIDMIKSRPDVPILTIAKRIWAEAIRERTPQINLNCDRPIAFPELQAPSLV